MTALIHRSREPATHDNISDAMRAIVDAIHAEGFQAYMRQAGDTWVYFTDGTRIGYAQLLRDEGLSIGTCHVPNTSVGTGFKPDRRAGGPLNRQDMEDAFAFCPDWVNSRDRAKVTKWRDWAHFHNRDTFSRGYVLIEPPKAGSGAEAVEAATEAR